MKSKNVFAQEREWQIEEAEHRAALSRTQRELEALQALSQSLANENKGLREERVELEERIGELREKAACNCSKYCLLKFYFSHAAEKAGFGELLNC